MSGGQPEPEVRVVSTRAELDALAAEEVARRLGVAIERRGRASLCLAGGETPLGAYRHLADSPLTHAVSWGSVDFLFGDERCVPADSPASNQGRARAALLDPLHVPAARVHPIPVERGADEAARRYAVTLAEVLGEAPFDVVLLGLGADGHTASLFPGSPALDERRRSVVPATGPPPHRERVTLTLPRLAAARSVLFLVSGASKAGAVGRVLGGDVALPAAHVRPAGELVWLLDAAAGAELAGGA